MDPMGRYWLDYSKMSGELAYDLTGIPNGKLYVRYSDQHKSGWKQTLTIDHCATCHVESNRREVDEQTRMFAVGTEGTMRNLTFNYEFEAQDFTDSRIRTPAPGLAPSIRPETAPGPRPTRRATTSSSSARGSTSTT